MEGGGDANEDECSKARSVLLRLKLSWGNPAGQGCVASHRAGMRLVAIQQGRDAWPSGVAHNPEPHKWTCREARATGGNSGSSGAA